MPPGQYPLVSIYAPADQSKRSTFIYSSYTCKAQRSSQQLSCNIAKTREAYACSLVTGYFRNEMPQNANFLEMIIIHYMLLSTLSQASLQAPATSIVGHSWVYNSANL